MASTTLNSRIVLCSKNTSTWASEETVALKGELLVELTSGTPKLKMGDGVHTFAELDYLTMTPSEISSAISSGSYNLSPATANDLGGVKIGSNISVANDGTISVASGSTSATGVVQLSDATNSTSTSLAATANAVKKAYDLANGKVGSVALASGTNNGTLKLTVDGTATDNIAVTGLGSAAYTASTAYATAAQGTAAENAMPKSGGTFTGGVTLNADPTTDLGAATKQYVDTKVTTSLAASDAMVFKGTLGTGGTVTAVPTSNVVKGDTYKVITAGTWAGSTCKVGDLLIALASGSVSANTTNWAYVPSGDESVTTIKYSTTTQNLTTSAQTGDLIVGEAATKQVDTSISAASTSTKLPTSAAVATFVEGKGYVTADEKVKQTVSTANTAYPLLASASASPTSGNAAEAIYAAAITVNPSTSTITATNFAGNASTATSATSATSAGKLSATKNFSITGKGTAAAVAFDGSSDVALNMTAFNANGLTQTSGDVLILDGNFGTASS